MKFRCCQHLSAVEIASIQNSQPVLLVGSAVSDFIPTNLPSGGPVASDLLELLAQSGTGASWPPWLIADAGRLPFEAVLEAYPDQQKLPAIIIELFGNPGLRPNSLHSAIGDGLIQGLFSALVTTNYDLAFDNYFAGPNPSVSMICREQDFREWDGMPCRTRPYWKIHGSALRGSEDTIVVNLAHERRMDDWKRKFLEQLVFDRTIVFLGYSGRDFDICPELSLKKIRASVWLKWKWNENGERGLNANQRRVLENGAGTAVIGDLHSFLGRLCSRSIENHGRQTRSVNLADYFDMSLLPEWRVRVLDRLACPSRGLPMLVSLPRPGSIPSRSLRASLLAHAGRYRQAARVVESQIVDATSPTDQLTYLMNAANSWYVYGARFKSRSYLRRSKQLARLIGPNEYQQACLAKIELMYWMRRARFWKDVPFRRLHTWIRERATTPYRAAVEIFERTNLDNLYILQHDAERIGIAEPNGFAAAANLGFVALGLRGMQCLKERDRIMSLRRSLG